MAAYTMYDLARERALTSRMAASAAAQAGDGALAIAKTQDAQRHDKIAEGWLDEIRQVEALVSAAHNHKGA